MIKICNYCGHFQENDEDERCECGGYFIRTRDSNREYYSWEREEIMAEFEGDFECHGFNSVDNILEWKRSKIKTSR